MLIMCLEACEQLILCQEPMQLLNPDNKRVCWKDTEVIVIENNKFKNLNMIVRRKMLIKVWRQHSNVRDLRRRSLSYQLLNIGR
jgi:hypothetical protein